ncbi:hypothetical protein CHLRE_16g686350v5 [Chlamydomonas reinhardtii]|uniref:WHEP-TRS domain-containing protein n=1 Tax=Chlamydomonas reinhardtii TaxID=3055 RepID=A0A2K3CUR1_CHLRE|nr:uncharacterized protein CHLRE_16g686350v5 [Chlamydomonas reinhardtii]PNW72006.1 hypothetical protein CHLRE_16g686350v5 [Chlamydomonas reinhardtii]
MAQAITNLRAVSAGTCSGANHSQLPPPPAAWLPACLAHPPLLASSPCPVPRFAPHPQSPALAPRSQRLVCSAAPRPWRPSIDDIDSISWGGRAKVRGTGSRKIPHRLNAEERGLYDMAKKKGYVAVRGTAYRKERHGNPLPNVYRQWCDAKAQLCVVVEQDRTGSAPGGDQVVVDLAPLRREATEQVEAALAALAAECGLRRVPYQERPLDALPWNILADWVEGEEDEEEEGEKVEEVEASAPAAQEQRRRQQQEPMSAAELEAVRAAVAAQAAAVRQLKDSGLGNKAPEVVAAVEQLMQLKAELQQAEAAVAAADASPAPVSAAVDTHPLADTAPTSPSSSSSSSPSAPSPSPSAPAASAPEAPAASATTATAVAGGDGPSDDGDAAVLLPAPRRSPVEHYYSLPIWRIHAVPLFYQGERAAAKAFAAAAVKTAAAALGSAAAGGGGGGKGAGAPRAVKRTDAKEVLKQSRKAPIYR